MYKPVSIKYKTTLREKGQIVFRPPSKRMSGPRFEAHIIYSEYNCNAEMLLAKCHITFSTSTLYLETFKFSNLLVEAPKEQQLMYLEMIIEAAMRDAQLMTKTMLIITTDVLMFEEIVTEYEFKLRSVQNLAASCKFSAVKYLK